MANPLSLFERVARRANEFSESRPTHLQTIHPFEERSIHPKIDKVSRKLFDDGHYSQATFEAYKYLENEVKKHSGLATSGLKLMMKAFNENSPLVRLTSLSNQSDKDEQEGFKHMFAGSTLAIRNPRGHEILTDPVEVCLDHLGLASLLLRRLEAAGFR